MFKKNEEARKLEKFGRDKEYSCMEHNVNAEARKAFERKAYSKPRRMTLEEYYEERCKKRGKK